jgi:hypothetical protein
LRRFANAARPLLCGLILTHDNDPLLFEDRSQGSIRFILTNGLSEQIAIGDSRLLDPFSLLFGDSTDNLSISAG